MERAVGACAGREAWPGGLRHTNGLKGRGLSRHFLYMKALACLTVLFAAGGWADEAADRAAIRQTIGLLNVASERSAQFTSDADGKARLEAAIHEPRRETTSNEPLAADYWPFWPAYLQQPWLVKTTSIRLITADVALAHGTVRYRQLLFVLKKEQAGWKIASVSFVAP